MKPTSEEYFYFEWLIIEKNMTVEAYSLLTNREIYDLKNEYNNFRNNLK